MLCVNITSFTLLLMSYTAYGFPDCAERTWVSDTSNMACLCLHLPDLLRSLIFYQLSPCMCYSVCSLLHLSSFEYWFNKCGSECIVSKKRKTNPEVYKRNVIQIAKVKGKKHVNWKDKHVKGRITAPNCNCSKMCFTKLSDEEKREVLNHFNAF